MYVANAYGDIVYNTIFCQKCYFVIKFANTYLNYIPFRVRQYSFLMTLVIRCAMIIQIVAFAVETSG